jgi:hypothetical protein
VEDLTFEVPAGKVTGFLAGPHRANQALAAYLRAERELGRIPASVDPDTGAAMLLAPASSSPSSAPSAAGRSPAAERTHLAASLATSLLPDRAQPGHENS